MSFYSTIHSLKLPLCVALSCIYASAQSVQENPIIQSIAVKNRSTGVLDESFVRSHISSEVGKEVNSKIVSRDVRNLLDSNRFTYVGTKISDVEGGIQLTYVVERRLKVTGKIDFVGMDAIRKSRALELIEVNPGTFADAQIIGAAAERLKKEYIRKRYYDVKIEPILTPTPNNPTTAKLTFSITEGTRHKVNLIQIDGNKAINDRSLRRVSGQSPWWNPSGWFAEKRVSDFELELMKADMRKQYLDEGYLDVDISAPQKTIENYTWDIQYDVTEGPRYTVGTIELEGVSLFPESMVRGFMPIKAGDVAGLTAIERARSYISDFFTSRGYIKTRVQTSTYPDEKNPGVLNIIYSVHEGTLTHVRNISIRGNTVTKDKVIRREILLNPGDIYNGVIADRSQRRLKNLGYFSDVRRYDVPVDNETSDLIYELDEQSTGSMMIGAGFSSVDNLIGMFEISQSNFDLFNFHNFRGAGQKARLSLQVSSDATDLEASFIEPWFLDRMLSFDLTGFIRNRTFSEYDERKGGFSLGLAKHIPWVGRMSLSYNLQQVSLSDVDTEKFFLVDSPETAFSYTDENDSYLLGSTRLTWTYDTRDNPMIPHSGTRSVAQGILYNSAFGSEYDMYELDFRWRNYQPLWYGHVISFSVHGSTIDTMNSDETVPISSRYFLGGSRSARGFKYRNIGPKAQIKDNPYKDDFNPVGGQTLLEATVEYTIPLASVLRFAIFYDIGNVWSDSFDFDLNEYASSCGAGLRLDIPGFPIRLDYAHALTRDDDLTRDRSFVFWIGFDN